MPLYDRETKRIPVKLFKVGVFTDNPKTLKPINKTLVTLQTELDKSPFMANCFGNEIKNMEQE